MAYPEKGATYRHEPKFIERMKAEEKRADGGRVSDDPVVQAAFDRTFDNGASVSRQQRSFRDMVTQGHAAEDARQAAANRTVDAVIRPQTVTLPQRHAIQEED